MSESEAEGQCLRLSPRSSRPFEVFHLSKLEDEEDKCFSPSKVGAWESKSAVCAKAGVSKSRVHPVMF